MIKEFIIKDVRCFAGENRLKIRPLTFLVGENSTGKSTILGCFSALFDTLAGFRFNEDLIFDWAPYEMGIFSDMVRKTRKDNNQYKYFSLGFSFEKPDNERIDVFCKFEEKDSKPYASQFNFLFSNGGGIIIKSRKNNSEKNISFEGFTLKKKEDNIFVIVHNADYFERITMEFLSIKNIKQFAEIINKYICEFNQFANGSAVKEFDDFFTLKFSCLLDESIMNFWHNIKPNVISVSPVRSRPKRTYSDNLINFEMPEGGDPEGDDVPMYLMRLKRTSVQKLQRIQKSLSDFGKASGLFSDISVKAYGKGMNEPFQLQIKIRGTKNNLLDVGYGVSQILPILTRIFTMENATLLIQQPEVHLHPRAQAELASLFIDSIADRKQKFIIETHSDYMIKRARIEIRKGKISKDDVSLIYMEPKGGQVKVHNIGFDDNGNLLNVPPGYRHFFINESDTFLGFKD